MSMELAKKLYAKMPDVFAKARKKFGPLGLIRQLCDFRFNRSGDDDSIRPLPMGALFHFIGMTIPQRCVCLIDIANVKHWLARHELHLFEDRQLFGIELTNDTSRGLAIAEGCNDNLRDIEKGSSLLVAALGFLGGILLAFFQAFEIGQHQFGVHDFGIAQWIDGSLDMRDFAFETAQQVQDRIDFANVGQELIAKPFAL